MVMSRDQNAGRSHNIKTDNSSFERVGEFKYLGTTLTNQNSIQEEIKSRFRPGKVCYRLLQNLLSSSLLPKIQTSRYTELYFRLLLCMGVELFAHIEAGT